MSEIKVKDFIESLPEKLMADPGKISGMKCVYQFNIDGDSGGRWYVTIDDGKVTVNEGGGEDPDSVITMADTDFLELISGSLAPQMAFMMGKLKVAGNMGLALKLGSFLKA
jgi:putative sterol carrier protein